MAAPENSIRSIPSSPAIPPEFVVRIDEPRDQCWSLSDQLDIRGVFLATEQECSAIRKEPGGLRIIVQEHCDRSTIMYANMALYGRALEKESTGEIVLESFEVSTERSDLPAAAPSQFGKLWNVSAKLNLSRVDFPNQAERTFLFLFRLDFGDRTSESNPVRITFLPPELRTATHGGLSFPLEHRLSADILIVDGWAVHHSDPVQRAEIYAAEHLLGAAEIGVGTGNEPELFPFTEDPKDCCFTFALRRNEFLKKPFAAALSDTTFPLRASVTFHSGKTLEINGPQFRWDPVGDLNGFTAGELESVRVAGEGLIEISGWVVDEGFAPIQIFLEGRKWRTPLPDVVWRPRADIASRFPQAARGNEVGFTGRFHPQLLGSAPGFVRVSAETSGRRTMLGSNALWAELSGRIAKLNDSPSLGRATVSRVLSRIGIRKSFKAPDVPLRAAHQAEKFLFVTHNFSPVEGAPRVLLSIVDGVIGSGVSSDRICVASPKDGELRKSFEARGIAVKLFPQLDAFNQNWERYHSGLREASETLSSFAPDFVFANVIDSFWAIDLARRSGWKSFWLIHESVPAVRAFQGLDPKLRTLFLFSLSRCARVGFVAKKTAELFGRFVEPERSVVIPNGIDLSAIDQSRSTLSREQARAALSVGNKSVVTIVGTTTARKGQDIFLKEIARLRELQPQRSLCCFIVGARNIPFLRELKSLCHDLGLDDTVHFVPETSDVAKYFIAADAIVISSREESAPLVSLEAFAYERPLVSTSVFGLAEQLEHEQNALIFDAADEGSMARALIRIFDEPALRERLVKTARSQVEDRFSIKRSVAGYLKEIAC